MGSSQAREMRMAAKSSNADFIGKIDQKTGSILYFFKQDDSALCGKFDWNSASFKMGGSHGEYLNSPFLTQEIIPTVLSLQF